MYPLAIGIADDFIVPCVLHKKIDFASLVPGDLSTYAFDMESDDDVRAYHTHLRESWYATTRPKGGWDCLRHYEILAAGTVPFLVDLDLAPANKIPFLPRQRLWWAQRMSGVIEGRIDPPRFDPIKYFFWASELLHYTQHRLAASKIAGYVLDTLGPPSPRHVLFLLPTSEASYGGYNARNLFIGMTKLLGAHGAIDYPRFWEVYAAAGLRRSDMSTTGVLPLPSRPELDENTVRRLLQSRAVDAVVYTNAREPLPFWDIVQGMYAPRNVAFIDGHDHLNASRVLELAPWGRYFVREMEDGCPLGNYSWG